MLCYLFPVFLFLFPLPSRAVKASGQVLSCESRFDTTKPDEDLYEFVTRPELRAPIVNVSIYDKDKAAPGLIFVAPYADVGGHSPSNEFRTAQLGPHIYDMNGDLIWSGASLFFNRPTFDFRFCTINGRPHMSLVLPMWPDRCVFPKGAGVVLDNTYEVVINMTIDQDNTVFDMHEFNVLDDGSALLLGQSTIASGSDDLSPQDFHGARRDHIAREVDLQTRETIFEWRGVDAMSDSTIKFPHKEDWDYLHPNSVDKTSSGDYLVSARHTSTIYLVSGNDSSILWRLGGINSSFVHQDSFTFSRQHDARVRSEDSNGMIISFMDNAKADWEKNVATAETSSVLVVALNTSVSPMTATVLERTLRPDGQITPHAGNAQFLEGGNRLIDWVDGGFITEHTPSGEVVYQAKWLTERWRTYRAYKANFVAQPKELPVVRSFASATRDSHLATTVYVSWNGATEVRSWRVRTSKGQIIAESKKNGFETAIVCPGYHAVVYIEALNSRGQSLAQSDLQETELPPSWNSSAVPSQAGSFTPIAFTITVAFVVGAFCRELYTRFLSRGPIYSFLHASRLGYSKVRETAYS